MHYFKLNLYHRNNFSFLFLLLMATMSKISAQELALKVQLHGGLFGFRTNDDAGKRMSSISDQYYNLYESYPSSHTTSYGIGLNLDRITRGGFLFGLSLDYEVLRAGQKIEEIHTIAGMPYASTALSYIPYSIDVDGRHTQYNHFINAFPHVGFVIFRTGNLSLFPQVGADIAFGTKSHSKISIDGYTDGTVSIDEEEVRQAMDIRPRLQVNADLGSLGLFAGYSLGLSNWTSGMLGPSRNTYSRYFRLGLSYKLL